MAATSQIKVLTPPQQLLRAWERHMQYAELNSIAQHLGYLVHMKDIEPDRHLVQALVQTWDKDAVVFRLGNRELTPTLEEISSFLGAPF